MYEVTQRRFISIWCNHSISSKMKMGKIKFQKYWNKFLNSLIPNRREKLLIKMIRDAEEMGLYDEPFNMEETRRLNKLS